MMKKFIKVVLTIILVIVILALIFIPVSFNSQAQKSLGGTPTVIAHRGASGVAPENTLPAIDSALAAGVDYIEIDVHLSKDNRVVVMHDETVDRTTDGKGKIREMTSAEIMELDAGSCFSEEFRGTGVPFLEDVFDRLNGQSKLLIEIKKKGNQYPGIEEKIIALIHEYQAESWCAVQSFNDESLQIIHQNAPEIELHKLIVFKYRFIPYVFDGKMTRFSLDKYSNVSSVNMHFRFVNRRFSDLVHNSGKIMYLWGCREEAPCFPLVSGDYDGWITDYPKQWKEVLNSLR